MVSRNHVCASDKSVINEVRFSPDNPQKEHQYLTLSEYEEAESRRRITAILEQMEDRGAAYLDYLDEYFRDYQERCAEIDGSY